MRKQGKLALFIAMLLIFACMLGVSALANEVAPDNYVEDEVSYTVYNDTQYTEVFWGIYNGTLPNKKIVFGCNIETVTDFVLDKACDITIDLNGFTYKNYKTYNKSGDFDFQHPDAIIRISNGYIDSSFCVFIFRTQGQLYAEEITVSSNDECVYRYGNFHQAIISLKNCKMDARGNYPAVSLNGNCGGNNYGSVYMIEGGEYAGLNIYCPTEGSYIRDCRVYEQRLVLDTWHKHGGNNDRNLVLEIRNVNVEHGEIYLNDVALSPVLYDCTYTTINLSNKRDAVIVAYTSPTCTEAGTKTTYKNLTEIVVDDEYPLSNPALGHTIDTSNPENIIYENYMQTGKYVAGCKNCDAKSLTEEYGTAPSLFTSQGFSTPLNGRGELVISFFVNNDAIANYESVTKKTVNYGIFAASKSALGNNDVLDEKGNAINGVIKVDVNTVYESVELRLSGFITDNQKNAELAVGAFILETYENESEYSYIQYGESKQGEKYSFVTYNEIYNQGE